MSLPGGGCVCVCVFVCVCVCGCVCVCVCVEGGGPQPQTGLLPKKECSVPRYDFFVFLSSEDVINLCKGCRFVNIIVCVGVCVCVCERESRGLARKIFWGRPERLRNRHREKEEVTLSFLSI